MHAAELRQRLERAEAAGGDPTTEVLFLLSALFASTLGKAVQNLSRVNAE